MPYRGPNYTCPHFDAAIAEIEQARSANIKMRSDAEEAVADKEEAEKQIETLEELVAELREEIEEANRTIRSLESSLSAYQREVA